MLRTYLYSLLLLFCATPLFGQVDFTGRVVATNRQIPWDMLEGPDGNIWFTERIGLVSRLDPDTRQIDTIFDMRSGILNLVEVGLLSMVLHPDFADTPYVYLSYVYRDTYEWVKHVSRFRYTGATLTDEKVLYELRPAELWHQGCRMLVLPDRTLMFTNGDQPAPDSTYSSTSEIGKILRIHLDGTIPTDNPYPGNRVWSRGHRNPQGLCMLPNGFVYSSEHGERIEDEINLIRKDGNYGWPKVEGMCDTPEEIAFCNANGVIEPAWSSGQVQTYAPAGIEYYGHSRYPSLTGKLISTHLKSSRIMAHTLSADQEHITQTDHFIQYRFGRIRDVLVMNNGRLFICTGNVGYKNIEPFPKSTDDVIVELLPVWQHSKPAVQARYDTIVYRTNVGDSVRAFIPFCGVSAGTVRYLDFQTTPGNMFQQRHWQDAATTEGSECWPFRVLYVPDSAYPHRAIATAWYDDHAGGRDSVSTVVVGLPYRGMIVSDQPTYDSSLTAASCTYAVAVSNIGDTAVTISGYASEPQSIGHIVDVDLPITIAPGASVRVPIRVDSIHGRTSDGVVTLLTDGLRDPRIRLITTFVVDSTTQVESESTILPFPVKDAFEVHNAPLGMTQVRIYDTQGRMVFHTDVDSKGTIRVKTSEFATAVTECGAYSVELIQQTRVHRYFIIVSQ
jgi:glucose/arabinose dehydrogenase